MAAASPAQPKAPPPVFGPAGTGAGTEAIDLTTSSAVPPSMNQTMMFGLKAPAAAEAPAAAPRPAATTAMFGAVAPSAASDPSKTPSTTMMFGKQALAGPEAALIKTMSFGAPASATVPSPGPGVPSGPVARTTMMFGAAAAEPPKSSAMPRVTAGAPVAAKITESTVRVDLGAMMAQGERGTTPSGVHGKNDALSHNEKTPPEGNFLTGDAGPDAGPPTDGAGSRPEPTTLFSMTPGGKPSTNSAPHSRELSTSGEITLPPATGRQLAGTSPGVPSVATGVLNQDLQNHSTGARGSRSQPGNASTLEPSSGELPAVADEVTDLPPHDDAGENEFAAIESATRRRNTIAVIVLLVAVLAAGSAVIWQLFMRQTTAGDDANVEKVTPRPVKKPL